MIASACHGDGAASMTGRFNSVWSRLSTKAPNCVLIKCVCHSLALIVQHAFDLLPSPIFFLLQEIPTWFSHSSFRKKNFRNIYELLNDAVTPNGASPFQRRPFSKTVLALFNTLFE